jgi:hypothetical protein
MEVNRIKSFIPNGPDGNLNILAMLYAVSAISINKKVLRALRSGQKKNLKIFLKKDLIFSIIEFLSKAGGMKFW